MTKEIDPDRSPTALFCALETALATGDFHRAADLRDRLERLGFKVAVRTPKNKAGMPKRASDRAVQP
ncbi:MAG TPA: hypothetical protein VGP72_31700 [Planctomycetota bacterium]|jgi:protein-arginine kinase activator protein McsA